MKDDPSCQESVASTVSPFEAQKMNKRQTAMPRPRDTLDFQAPSIRKYFERFVQ